MTSVVHILQAEDSPADQRLTRLALSEARQPNEVHVVGDGVEALAVLRREGPYGDAPRPDLVLLDLNMPRMGGREVLEQLKQDPDLRSIPVVVLTTSAAPGDVAEIYRLHGNSYVRKPVDLDQFLAVMRTIEDFWLQTVELPE